MTRSSAPSADVADRFQQLGGNQGHGFGIIQQQFARAALPRQFAGRGDQQLVNFSRREMYGERVAEEPRCNNPGVMPSGSLWFSEASKLDAR